MWSLSYWFFPHFFIAKESVDPLRQRCIQNPISSSISNRIQECSSSSQIPDYLFIGDSHAFSLWAGFLAHTLSDSYSSSVLASPGCSLVFNKFRDQRCTQLVNLFTSSSFDFSSTNVIFYQSDFRYVDYPLSSSEISSYSLFIRLLLNTFDEVTIISPTPVFTSNPSLPFCTDTTYPNSDCLPEIVERDKYDFAFLQYLSVVNNMSSSKLRIIDSSSLLCSRVFCSNHDHQFLYTDMDHLSFYGSSLLFDFLFSH